MIIREYSEGQQSIQSPNNMNEKDLGLISEEHSNDNTNQEASKETNDVKKNMISDLKSPNVSFVSMSKEENTNELDEDTVDKFSSLRLKSDKI